MFHQYGFSTQCKTCKHAAACAAMDEDCVLELGDDLED